MEQLQGALKEVHAQRQGGRTEDSRNKRTKERELAVTRHADKNKASVEAAPAMDSRKKSKLTTAVKQEHFEADMDAMVGSGARQRKRQVQQKEEHDVNGWKVQGCNYHDRRGGW